MPGKESRHAIRSECLSDQPVVQTGQPRLHLSENIWKPDAASRLPVSNLCFRRNSEFNSDYQRIGSARAEARASGPPSPFGLRRGSLLSLRPDHLRLACRAEAREASEGWWSRSGSNRRPQACKARALPTELRPQKSVQSGLPSRSCGRKPVFAPRGSDAAAFAASQRRLVGPGRVERPTSRLSGVRSNHLSYEPETHA